MGLNALHTNDESDDSRNAEYCSAVSSSIIDDDDDDMALFAQPFPASANTSVSLATRNRIAVLGGEPAQACFAMKTNWALLLTFETNKPGRPSEVAERAGFRCCFIDTKRASSRSSKRRNNDATIVCVSR